jgi:DNA repair exonuclease SbcCD ATPase subunit
MKITFDKLEFKNFLSYGNAATTFKFNSPGLTVLSGVNGTGKSTLLDALSYALYGKPYRKIKIAELVNRINQKGLWVRVSFKQNQMKYRITRTLKPTTILIEKWNSDINEYEELELLSSNKLIQEEINKIVGIDYNTFTHIVAIGASTSNSKPFLTMSSWEKRTLIEVLLNLEIIAKMNKLVKADRSANKQQLALVKNNSTLLQGIVQQNENNLNSSRLTIESFENVKQEELATIQKRIDVDEERKKDLLTKIKTLKSAVKPELTEKLKSKKSTIESEISTIQDLIGEHNGTVRHNKKMIKQLEETQLCPVCNTDVTDDHRTTEIDKFNIATADAKVELKTLKEKLEEHKASLKTVNLNLSDLNYAMSTISSVFQDIDRVDHGIKSLLNQHNTKMAHELNIDIDLIEEQLATAETNLMETTDLVNEYTTKESIIETANFLLSDGGVKTEFYQVVVPMFNKTVNEYIQKFELPIVINFDLEFDVNIQTLQTKSENVNYHSFSEGEKRRIEIAILLSFIKLSKSIANWESNILVADEIFDNGVDAEGLNIMLEAIREIAMNDQLSIFVVSHKLLSNDSFDNKILITKDALFSKLLQI